MCQIPLFIYTREDALGSEEKTFRAAGFESVQLGAGLVENNFRSNIVFGECFTGEGDVFSGSLPEVLVVRGGLVRFVGLATCLAWREQGSAF